MRTTICLDDALAAEVKKVAAASRRTMTAVIEDALRGSLLKRPAPSRRSPVRLTTFRGRGLQPGVDLDHIDRGGL